jgi:outer membrane protein TolC
MIRLPVLSALRAAALAAVVSAPVLALGIAAPVALAADLSTALAAAEQHDPTLAAARANRDAAAEAVPLARSRLMPQASIDITARRLEQTSWQTSIFGEQRSDFDGPTGSRQLTLRQALYRPRDWIGVEIGDAQARIGESRLASTWSSTWARTAITWLELLTAEAQRDAMAELVAAAQRIDAQTQARLARGESTRDVAAEAQAQLATARARLQESELVLASRRQALRLATGLAELPGPQWQLPPVLPVLPWSDADEAVAAVLAVNPELRAALDTSAIGERRLAQAKADHLPVIDATAALSSSESDSPTSVGSRFRVQQIGVQVSIPLYTGGGLTAAQRQAAAFASAADSEREAFEQQLRLRTQLQWASAASLRQRVAADELLVAAAREQLAANEAALQRGQRTVADVASAAVQLTDRLAELANRRLAVLSAQAQLLALLPTTDPAWSAWVAEVDRLARRR